MFDFRQPRGYRRYSSTQDAMAFLCFLAALTLCLVVLAAFPECVSVNP